MAKTFPLQTEHLLARSRASVQPAASSDVQRAWRDLGDSTPWRAPPMSMPRPISDALRNRFADLAEQWRRDAGMYSLEWQQAIDPSYQTIMAKGPVVVPLILEDLARTRGWWFWALRYLNDGVDVAADAPTFSDKVAAWITWGRAHGYIDRHDHAR